MLYDQRWDAKTKADPFSLESLIAWLEMQPADEEYVWTNCRGECLLSQYQQAMGLYPDVRAWLRIHGAFDCHHSIAYAKPHTFGAALTRARAVLTKRAGA